MSEMSLKQLDSCELVEMYRSSEAFELDSEDRGKRQKQTCLNTEGNFSASGSDPICYDSITKEGTLRHKHQEERQLESCSALRNLEGLDFDAGSPAFQSFQKDFTKLVNVKSEDSELAEQQNLSSEKIHLESLALLKNYEYRFRQLKGEKIEVISHASKCTKLKGHKLSTDAVIRLAGESFIQCSTTCTKLSDDKLPVSNKLLGLSAEDTKCIELVKNLLASAEKVGQKRFNRARKLLNKCSEWSSDKGNPVQRLVYYFSAALSEKIDHIMGGDASKSFEKQQKFDFEEAVMSPQSANIAFHKEVPFSQVSQFTGVQAIIEHVAHAKRIHFIDLVIMNGSNCIVLMQALAARDELPIEHLRITAIGTKSQEKIEETGKRLIDFAKSVNLPFSFNLIMVDDMLDLNEDLFDLKSEEVVVVQSSYLLSMMIAKSDRLEHVMRLIRDINPSIMVIIESEANYNSPVFVKRFVETLFYYGAFYDCMEDCMERSDPNRLLVELLLFAPAIQNIVVAEGKERTMRIVDMKIWREFFKRFEMVELEVSKSSLYQASLMVNKFASGTSCTLNRDGKCLIIGWKGTPIHSLSIWKFV